MRIISGLCGAVYLICFLESVQHVVVGYPQRLSFPTNTRQSRDGSGYNVRFKGDTLNSEMRK